MHDDRTMVEARIRRVLRERIDPARVRDRAPLEATAWEVPGEPVPAAEALAQEFTPFTVGSPFGRPWGTTWFRFAGRVPEGWAGGRVVAHVDLGFGNAPGFQAEGAVWEVGADGTPTIRRGIHPDNREVPVAAEAAGGEPFDLVVEAASNPDLTAHRPSPLSDVTTAGDAPLYALRAAELRLVEPEVIALREDLRALVRLMQQLPVDQPRRHEVLRAVEASLDALDLDDVAGTAAAARSELADALAQPAHASAHRISAIGHAHIDSAWLWPIRETRRKCARTFANVIDLMDRDPDVVFACSQAVQYRWIEEEHPELFARIAERVAEGRWVPVGGMWVEPDVNLASGEALIRQLTFGQRYFEERFGRRSTEVWIPDVFGYTGALPQIMRLGGIDRFLTQKLSWNKTNRFPHHTFLWEGIDGSTVYTHFPPVETYNATFHPRELAHAVRTFTDKGRARRSLMPFGHGDGGGGPTAGMLEQYRRLRDLDGSPAITIEAPEAFFDRAMAEDPEPPRWVGELYFETHRGTYTSQAGTKAGNRRSELLLREAELWWTAASDGRAGGDYPSERLARIWEDVLLHQFHDILPGSSIAWVHREAEATYARVAAELEELIADALARLAPADGPAVANAAPHDRREVAVVPTDVWPDGVDAPAGAQALDDGDTAVPVAVGALAVAPLADATWAPDPVSVVDGDDGIVFDNGVLRAVLDGDGLIASLTVDGRETIAPEARGNLLQLHPDLPTEYDAWDLDESHRHRVTDLVAADSVAVTDSGPLVARVAVARSFRSSRVVQTYELRAGSPRLDVRCEVDWHERDHVLKAAFPVDVHTDALTREIQMGHITTAIHTNTSWDEARFEVCAHRWVDASEPGFGVAVLNDAKYGHDATRTRHVDPDTGRERPTTTVRVTLLRGPQYPDPHADEGHHAFTLAIQPHRGTFREAGVVEEGYRLNVPVRVVAGGAADDGLAPPSAVSAHPAAVVETVKPADDGSGDVIVRLYEAHGARTPLDVTLAGVDPAALTVVDLMEEPTGAPVPTHLTPFQILTLRGPRP